MVLVLVVAVYIFVVVGVAISYLHTIYQSKRVYEGDPLFGSIDTPVKIETSLDYSTIEGYESWEERQRKYGIYADLVPVEFTSVTEAVEKGVRVIGTNYKDYRFVEWLQVGYFLWFLVAFTTIYSFALFAIWRINLYIIYGEKLIKRKKE